MPTHLLDDAHLRRQRESGIEFAVATLNDPVRAQCSFTNGLLANGAQSILTDYPDLLNSPELRSLP